MAPSRSFEDPGANPLRDSLVVFWAVFWLVVGGLVGYQLWSLADVHQAVAASGEATDRAGLALEELSELPLVPAGPGELGNEVRAAAEEISASADVIRQAVRRLSVLLGLSVALVPTVPVLALYISRRRQARAEVVHLRRVLASAGRTPQVDAYLAQRAVTQLDHRHLSAVTDDPVGDLLGGRHTDLATEQLRRMGIAPDKPPGSSGT